MILPENFSLIYKKEDISNTVKSLGEKITPWAQNIWRNSHTDLLTIPVLRGGLFFFADLVREIKTSVEIAPIKTYAYNTAENSPLDQVTIDIKSIPAKNRSILLVDDICDSGRTLKELTSSLIKAGATEVKSVTLIHRLINNSLFTPNWFGFQYSGDEWFVGYGMEDRNRFRNLPDIYIIKKQ